MVTDCYQMITPCLILHWNQKNAKGPLWALWFVHSGLQWKHSGANWKTNSRLLKCKRLIQVILHKGKQNSKYHILLLPVEPPKSYTLRCTHSFVRSIMVKLNHVWYTEKKKEIEESAETFYSPWWFLAGSLVVSWHPDWQPVKYGVCALK